MTERLGSLLLVKLEAARIGAVLVRVVPFGQTPRQPSSTGVPMRLIGLAVVLTLSLTLVPLAAEAQPTGKVVRLGRLSLTGYDAQAGGASTDAILDGLRELGYTERRDFILERRDAGGDASRLQELALELARLPVDVLLVTGVTATAAARRATGTIPIVCMMGDPVGRGFVKSLARPGGNITGVTLTSGGSDIGGKYLQLLREVAPNASRIGFLRSANNPATLPTVFFPAASLSGIQLVTVEMRDPSGLNQAFDALIRAKVQAFTSDGDPLTDAEFAPLTSDISQEAIRRRWGPYELRAECL